MAAQTEIIAALSSLYTIDPEELLALRPALHHPRLDMEEASGRLLDYYGRESAYRFVAADGRERVLPVVVPAAGVRVPLCSAAEQATAGPLESPPSPTAFPAPLLARYAQSFLGPDPGIWDDDILLLRSVDLRAVDRVRAEFTTGRFLQWRFTCGLLREELALHQQMPLRQILLRDTAALLAYDLRYTAGGVQTLCAFARPAPFDDYVIPLQLRGKRIAEGGGNYGVVPMGVHSPAPAGPLVVAAPSTSGLREMYEELFGGPEHRPGQPPPPLFTEHPAIAWILDHRERVTWEMTAFCVSMIHGNYDFACLLAVHDAEFWTRFGGLMEASWESEEHLFLSSKDEAAWRAVLAQPNWESQAMIACVEGRKRLAELV